MGNYDPYEPESAAEPDLGLNFTIFMLVFWPVTLLLGLIDFIWITSYDLHWVNLVLGGAIGWLGVVAYHKRQERKRETSS